MKSARATVCSSPDNRKHEH